MRKPWAAAASILTLVLILPLTLAPAGAAAKARPTVLTRELKVGGKRLDVLTTSAGFTLYYFTPDKANHATCTGGCAQYWPPLTLRSGKPVAPKGLKGKLADFRSGGALQVSYNGHPLYTYASDSKPGQANGQGASGQWYVATAGLKPLGHSR